MQKRNRHRERSATGIEVSVTNNQQTALFTAPFGGAFAGAIGAAAARHSNDYPILKGALAAGLVDGVLSGIVLKVAGNVNEEALRGASVGALAGSAIGAMGAAASETSRESPVLKGALAGGVLALLFTGARVVAEGLRQSPPSTLSGAPLPLRFP